MVNSNSFTDQKPRIATQKDCESKWGLSSNNDRFRCYLCGYKFVVGDYWRWQYSAHLINFLVCENCDGPDVLEKWNDHHKQFLKAKDRFFAFMGS